MTEAAKQPENLSKATQKNSKNYPILHVFKAASKSSATTRRHVVFKFVAVAVSPGDGPATTSAIATLNTLSSSLSHMSLDAL
ncbi:hypothetical protein L596_013003 [Steinernema carpocapsae]|uniref:Uncharacterized protein n=1 Tax=Steinernema carpocapsae TaxID=34508 RepID=A0A4U5NYS6_STECR|nr:hypothetical protein L596_013003 [Steinernema carpocapsae]